MGDGVRTRVRPWPKEDAVRVSARARGRMRVGSEWHLLSSSRLEQAVYASSTLVTTQMLTQMLLATVSLCVLCETAVGSRPCAQLLPQRPRACAA